MSATDPPSRPGDSASPPPQKEPNASHSGRAVWYPRILIAVVAMALGYLSLQRLWGEGDATSWSLFGGAAISAAASLAGWRLVVRAVKRTQQDASSEPGARDIGDWLGFPLLLLGLVGTVPLLVMAVSPAARSALDPQNRIDAEVVRLGDRRVLQIVFPQPLHHTSDSPPPINITLGSVTVPATYIARKPDLFSWSHVRTRGDFRRLRIDFDAVQRDLELGEVMRVGINASADRAQLRDARGERIPQQWVRLDDR